MRIITIPTNRRREPWLAIGLQIESFPPQAGSQAAPNSTTTLLLLLLLLDTELLPLLFLVVLHSFLPRSSSLPCMKMCI